MQNNRVKEIAIEFFGPFILASVNTDVLNDCAFANKRGLYIWAVEMPNKTFRITYIGETQRSFYLRTKEHIVKQLGGYYRVCEPNKLKNGECDFIWDGLWGKDSKNRFPEFLSNYLLLAPKIKESLLAHSIFLAPLNVEADKQKRIESAIASEVRKNSNESALFLSGVKYDQPLMQKENFIVKIKSSRVLEGLPTEINL